MSENESSAAEPTSASRGTAVPRTLLLALSAAALWGSSRMTWVHLTSSDGKTLERTTDLDGSTWAAAMTPLALALLAAIAASFAVARLGTSGSRTVGCPRRRRGSGSGSAVVGVRSLCGPSGGLGRVVRSPGRSLYDFFGTACLACVGRSGGGARRGSTSDAQTSSARRVVVEIRQPCRAPRGRSQARSGRQTCIGRACDTTDVVGCARRRRGPDSD